MQYFTGQVAKFLGVHPNTVRLYEELNLISKVPRNMKVLFEEYEDSIIFRVYDFDSKYDLNKTSFTYYFMHLLSVSFFTYFFINTNLNIYISSYYFIWLFIYCL
ncbi:MerR family transcriptional regulator [Clostridium tetanomorphum DSM 665]|uniref:MerR family DNA-binding transcriptional regulator n=1 Tax=Clostridium tetanomorphum TaxID=1553 RepID=A0A923ED55_CLOTT|nr:MerR family transcriptional regulator [Clostridium tetanomorphum DSM 665]MBC2398358.1 MerR family DNA-binding transcriptional regulator [Clostridium tetanomorphum]